MRLKLGVPREKGGWITTGFVGVRRSRRRSRSWGSRWSWSRPRWTPRRRSGTVSRTTRSCGEPRTCPPWPSPCISSRVARVPSKPRRCVGPVFVDRKLSLNVCLIQERHEKRIPRIYSLKGGPNKGDFVGQGLIHSERDSLFFRICSHRPSTSLKKVSNSSKPSKISLKTYVYLDCLFFLQNHNTCCCGQCSWNYSDLLMFAGASGNAQIRSSQ